MSRRGLKKVSGVETFLPVGRIGLGRWLAGREAWLLMGTCKRLLMLANGQLLTLGVGRSYKRMKEKLISRINQSGSFKEEECRAFSQILNEAEFEKKDFVLKPGKIANEIHFIIGGGFRSYFIKNGEEITDYFFFENSFATDYASYYQKKPTIFYLEAIAQTYTVFYKRTDVLKLAKEFPVFQTFLRIHAEKAFIEIEERMRLLQHEPLNVKYEYTLSKFPELFQRVPQHQIASYLGVKPESLSRIKQQKSKRKIKS